MKKNVLKVLTCLMIFSQLNAQVKVKDISATKFCSVGNTLFFLSFDPSGDCDLWKTDGTGAGTVLVKKIHPTKGGVPNNYRTQLIAFNGEVYFPADDGVNGIELWKSDGTSAGTIMVKDIQPNTNPNFKSGWPNKFFIMNNTLFFCADDYVGNTEWWKTDGTSAGTVLLKDILPGQYGQLSGNNTMPVEMNGVMYFEARDATNASPQLWKSDGTTAGTVKVLEITGSTFEKIVTLNNKIYFKGSGDFEPNGTELFVSDGTTGGTQMLKDINPGQNSSTILKLTSYNGKLFFIAKTQTEGFEMWTSDGTASGTTLVKDINPGTASSMAFSTITELVPNNGYVYFFAANTTNGMELWRTDGTTAGTTLVKDIIPGPGNQTDSPFMGTSGGILYFAATNGTSYKEVWRSDGTESGTFMLNEINISNDADPKFFHDHQGVLYFIANDGTGHDLWKYDGPDVGVKEFEQVSKLRIYPNPAVNKVVIQVKNEMVGSKFIITDCLGNIVKQGNLLSANETLDISELVGGAYILNVHGMHGQISTKLLKR